MSDSTDLVETYLDKLTKVISEGVGNPNTRKRFLTICTDASYMEFRDRHLELVERFLSVAGEFASPDDEIAERVRTVVSHLTLQHQRLEGERRAHVRVVHRLAGCAR